MLPSPKKRKDVVYEMESKYLRCIGRRNHVMQATHRGETSDQDDEYVIPLLLALHCHGRVGYPLGFS